MANLPPVINALLKPDIYPEPTKQVSLIQTQMSFILLTDNFVYKVKKPVNLGYLDYSTLDKRLLFSRKEVELNQRLCPEAYLGVLPITQEGEGFVIDGRGKTVEYAVKMRRLPTKAMMDTLLGKDAVTPEMIDRLAGKIAHFHRHAETGEAISTFGGLDVIRQNTEENFSQTEKYIGQAITQDQFDRLSNYSRRFIEEQGALIARRQRQNFIRDLHGDLHAAHICFCHDICIYDCIEFNERFRYGDVASEVAFLAMDLDHYGRADLSRIFVADYIRHSHDKELATLLTFYKSYRAYIRGKVACFQMEDPYSSDDEKEKARQTAKSYFDLANFYVKPKPTLFITIGLVGSGKSSLASALASHLGLVAVSSDTTRKKLAGIPPTEPHHEEFESGIYSMDFTRHTYENIMAKARNILNENRSVILDASFSRREDRQTAMTLAKETGASFLAVETTLNEEATRQRLAERLEQTPVSDGRWEIYQKQKGEFEPADELPAANHVIIDTSKPVAFCLQEILKSIDKL